LREKIPLPSRVSNGARFLAFFKKHPVMVTSQKKLDLFGFNMKMGGGVHTSRTIMLLELETLLSRIADSSSLKTVYQDAIINDNCLSKRTENTRKLTFQHLVELYGLDPHITLFRALLFFWGRDVEARPLLALLCAYSRDPLLRAATPFVLAWKEEEIIAREALELYLEGLFPGRFSPATLKSTAQNLNSTWTKSGHLTGKTSKSRTPVIPTPGALCYALFLGYLSGTRGQALLTSEYVRILNCPVSLALTLAEEASRKGWIVWKRVDDVMEVHFPNLLNEQEAEWIREQS